MTLDRQQLRDSTWAGLAAAAIVVAAVTVALYPLQELDPGVSSGVLYVLGVLLLTVTWGWRLGLVTSVASALALWIFHTSPGAGLSGIEAQDVAAIVVLLITEVVAVVIADRARHRARLEEVEASRARVLEAADAERKRVVRDLHDGAQQRLVHTVIRLKLAHRALEQGDTQQGGALVDESLEQAEHAVTELRELAHGILPAALLRGGLPAGIEALADRMPIPVAVEVGEDRFPPAVEATAYFVVAEALTNVAKYAGATRAEASALVNAGRLVVTVTDDGAGGADGTGSGLTGLADRLAVINGALAVRDGAAGGTVIEASIPLS